MVKCSIFGCSNYHGMRTATKPLRYFCFPKNPEICKQWISACGKKSKINLGTSRICSEHFTDSDWKLRDVLLNLPDNKRRLKEDAVPTINLPEVKKSVSKRLERQKKRERQQLVEESIASYERLKALDEISTEPTVADNFTIEFLDVEQLSPRCNELNQPKDVAVQTEVELECGRELEIMSLRRRLRDLRRQYNKISKRLHESESATTSMSHIFTNGQIRRLKDSKKKHLKWSTEDISSAISLHSAGPRLYRLLRKRNYPLPAASTLRKWAAKLKLEPGILDSVLHLLEARSYDEIERLCVLSFAKMKLKTCFDYDESTENVINPYNYVQVVMVRGLFKNWKQIIYYEFDTAITTEIFKNIVQHLKNINFMVVAVISDMESSNMDIWNDLGINETSPSCSLEQDEKIFFFADVPYLIKLLRDNFVDDCFYLDGNVINSDPVKELLNLNKSDIVVYHNLTNAHLCVKKTIRQMLKFATQLFSHSVSTSIITCYSQGLLHSPNSLECSKFINDVNSWFDIFNSDKTKAYGLTRTVQDTIINEMSYTISRSRVGTNNELLPFQKGILLNNLSLPQLYDHINAKFGANFILTNRLHIGALEHIFEIIRSKGCSNEDPTQLEFKYRLRTCILGNYK